MKLLLEEKLTDLSGEVLVGQDGKPFTVGKALANVLITVRQDGTYSMDKFKLYILAQKMYKEKEIEIDEADLKGVITMVETDKIFGPVVAGKLLELLGKK